MYLYDEQRSKMLVPIFEDHAIISNQYAIAEGIFMIKAPHIFFIVRIFNQQLLYASYGPPICEVLEIRACIKQIKQPLKQSLTWYGGLVQAVFMIKRLVFKIIKVLFNITTNCEEYKVL